MIRKVFGYSLPLTLILLLSLNVFIEPIGAQLLEAPLPILPENLVNDAPLLHLSKVGDTVRLLIRVDSSKEVNLPEGSTVLRRFSLIPYYAVEVPFNKLNEVKGLSIQPDRVFNLQVLKKTTSQQSFIPGVVYPHLGSFPALLNETSTLIGADKVWAEGYKGRGVVIAIIDTGIDKNHPDLDDLDDDPLTDDPKILAEIAFLPGGSNDTRDVIGHGTHVASIAAGTGASGGRGFKTTFASTRFLNATIAPYTQRGVAPEAYLYNIKVFNESGLAYESDIIAGIEWAVKHGADVINLSLGGTPTTSPFEDPLARAVEEAVKNNVVVCVAAGNSGPGLYSILSPATSPSAISVGAVYETGELTYFSSRGPTPFEITSKPDILAVGAAVLGANAFYSKKDEPAYVEMWGTSMSTPQVAGAAALLIQAFPGISALGVKAALMKGAKSLHLDQMFQGAGLLDVKGAFEAAKSANHLYKSYGATIEIRDATPSLEAGDPLIGARVITIGSDSNFSVFLNLLKEKGAEITKLPVRNNLADVDLSSFHLLFIPQPEDLSSPAYNTSLIHRFVADGGSLLFVGDLLSKSYDRFTEPYGIRWSNAGGGGISTKIAKHTLTTNVSALEFGNPTASLLIRGGAEAIAYDPFFIGIAAWENSTNGGRVLVIADDDLLNNKYINASDNKLFALNAARWLMTQQGQPKVKVHEVGVRLRYPVYTPNQSLVRFIAEVSNFGAYDEEVLLKLKASFDGRLLLNIVKTLILKPHESTSFEHSLNVSIGKAAGHLNLRLEAALLEKEVIESNNVVEAEMLVLPKLNRTGVSPVFTFLTPKRIDSFTPPLITLYPGDFKVLKLGVYTTEQLDAALELKGNVSALASFSDASRLTLHHKVAENVDPVPYLYNYGSSYSRGYLASIGKVDGFASAAIQIIIPTSAKIGTYRGEVLLKNGSKTLASTEIVIEVKQPKTRMIFDDVFQGLIQNSIYYPQDAERLWGGSFQGLDVFMWWKLLSENGVDVDSLWQTLYDRGEDDPWSTLLSGEYDVVVLHDAELHNYRRSLLPSILKKGLGLIIHLDVGFESASLTQFNLEARQNFIDGFLNPLTSLKQLRSSDVVPLYSALTLTLDEASTPLATAYIPYIPGSSGVVMAAYTSNEGGRLIVLGESNLYEVPDDFTWLYFKLLFDVDVASSAWSKLALVEVEYASKPSHTTYFTTQGKLGV
ncbi:MAG: S8 family peptidase [Nitrososphaerales archaeon]